MHRLGCVKSKREDLDLMQMLILIQLIGFLWKRLLLPANCASIPAKNASIPGGRASSPGECASIPGGRASSPGECASTLGGRASTPGECASILAKNAGTPGKRASTFDSKIVLLVKNVEIIARKQGLVSKLLKVFSLPLSSWVQGF